MVLGLLTYNGYNTFNYLNTTSELYLATVYRSLKISSIR